VELYLHSPNTPSWRGTQLKHRDNFTFTFYVNEVGYDDEGLGLMEGPVARAVNLGCRSSFLERLNIKYSVKNLKGGGS
jgi:hypothetical protein